MPKISIITPVWCDISQKVDWLDEMIQSVLSQSVTDWEMILINDKSPRSLDPVKMKYATDSRLRWFENHQNSGPSMTRNTAVGLAEAECILPVDSDDVLPNNEVLEYMYDTWMTDKTKTIYGNLQLYTEVAANIFERGKVIELAPYSFENAMNLGGTMPVTCMHSKEAHYQSGGWKADLSQGREDVEYWIAAGKSGFCGQKIAHNTLLYRKHEQSRDYNLRFGLKKLDAVQRQIKAMHNDIYSGRFPMACCGGKGATNNAPTADPVLMSQQNQSKEVRIVTELEGYPEEQLEWVAYRGPKMGRSGSILTRGPRDTPAEYPVLGRGHVFQIHRTHRKLFEQRQKLGFEMNQPDPRQAPTPEPVSVPVDLPAPQVVEVPKPQMSTIVSFDAQAAQTREADVQIIQEPQMPTDYLKPEYSLSDLGMSPKITAALSGYTVEKLAAATQKELAALPGIGKVTANKIIDKARELVLGDI